MSLALEDVPQGGAKCTYTHALLVISSLANFKWDGCNKSSLMIGPFKRVGIMQSMPTLSTNPNDLKQAVSLAVPAKTSNAKTWLICCPDKDQQLVKLGLLQRWS